MMDINRNNYEQYLLELLEGGLSPGQEQELRDFLSKNPDCIVPDPDISKWKLESKTIPYPGREDLKKRFPDATSQLSISNFDLFSIARMEGDLTPEQVDDHESIVKGDGSKRIEWEKWQNTKLVPGFVPYPAKSELKKKKGIPTHMLWLPVVSSAAAIALLFFLIRITRSIQDPLLAEDTGVVTEQEPPKQESGSASAFELPIADSDPDLTLPERSEPDPGLPKELPFKEIVTEGTFSIKRNPDPPELTGTGSENRNSSGQEGYTSTEPILKSVSNRLPLSRIGTSMPTPIERGTYDPIRPLELPPSPIHQTSLSLSQLSALNLRQVSELDLQQLVENYAEEKDISIWTIARSGINGINRITGADMSLLALHDKNGEVTGIRFESKHFSFTRPLDHSE